jgi:ABC-2 type transport system permease protein
MSTADLASRPAAWAGSLRSWVRLLRSELGLVFGRVRNLVLLAVLAAVPVLLGVVLKVSSPQPGGAGDGPAFLGQVTGNGVFLAFLTLVVELTLILPLAIAVVAGDSVAGEAGRGTLRYLLAVPAGRTRLLGIKFAAVVAFCLGACLLVAAVAVVLGAALFPVRPVTLLSGTTIPLAAGLLRLLFVVFYIAAAMAALGAIGLAISTLTEHAIGAIAAVLVIAVASEVADNVSQLAAVHPYLPTHWWLSFDALLRTPVDWAELGHGLLSFGVYAVIFCSAAWARFTTADVTS